MDHQTVIGREQHDEEDVCKLATAACLESNECRGGQETHEPSSPSTWMSASTFAEQLGIFAKSLTGCPEPIQRGTANAQPLTILEEVVRDRSSEVARRAEYSVATSGSIESDSEEQLNDESVQQPLFTNAQVTEVFDPTFRFCFEVPTKSLVHLPPARLNITRLVFCRNYAPGEIRSCTMGEACKFVHADVDFRTLEAHPIHVKYSWRREDLCTYARLPAGEVIRVSAPNNRPPVEEIPSDRVLVTRGSLRRHESHSPMSHCAHYFFNRMCNRGERCNFIHVVHVDPSVVGEFKRAPCCKPKSNNGDRATSHQQAYENIADWSVSAEHPHTTSAASFRPSLEAKPFFPEAEKRPSGIALGSVMINSVLPVQMPQPPPPPSGDATPAPTTQYGMLVFVPCDPKQSSTAVTPAVLTPANIQTGGMPSIQVLPTSALDLMNAAFPGLSERWASSGVDAPAAIASAMMMSRAPVVTTQSTTLTTNAPQWVPQAMANEWMPPGNGVPYYGVDHTRRSARTRGGGGGGGNFYGFR